MNDLRLLREEKVIIVIYEEKLSNVWQLQESSSKSPRQNISDVFSQQKWKNPSFGAPLKPIGQSSPLIMTRLCRNPQHQQQGTTSGNTIKWNILSIFMKEYELHKYMHNFLGLHCPVGFGHKICVSWKKICHWELNFIMIFLFFFEFNS